ncbi:MAG: porin family protein [Saprospiraceae bacterium]|nr:porin family protein [Saprospiraceae bacterium]MCF8250677.1 porin family protein [Saprospiraceae bacterium]MCF8282749.1 porin family protein [Bacteroidales bacterium]MCF8312529.1 porin family protein [Saprospiraceae bacterium]MCF8440791.1 porin family protein [Saprospiraceae bacterium]
MKDKLPNDRLEEFLRKSLEGHSEDPPGDLWSKIEANIEAPVVVQPQLTPVRGWWAVAAAAAVVMGLLVAQHLYFSSKLNQMSRRLEQSEQEMKRLETKKTTGVESQKLETMKDVKAGNSVASQNEGQNIDKSTVVEKSTAPRFSQDKSSSANAGVGLTKENSKLNSSKNSEQQVVPIEALDKKSGSEGLAEESQSTGAVLIPVNEMAENAELHPIRSKTLVLLDLLETNTPSVTAAIIPVSKLNGSNYSVGTNAMLMTSKNTIKSVRPLSPNMGGMSDKKSFRVNSEKSEQSWMAGVALEARISPNLRVGTGLNYRTIDYNTTHLFNFDFKDRRHDGGPMNDHEHEFQYDLNTAAGNIEMDVRAVSTEAASDIPDNAKVLAEINTSQHFTYLSLPVYANYTMGSGRLRALVKGGILFNFLKDSEFTIGSIRSLTNRFEFKKQEPQSGTPANLQSVTVDYLAGVGLEYNLSKALSLRLEPTVIGSITSRHNNPRIESSEFSAGINAGLMYNF